MQYCNVCGLKKQMIAELLKRKPERSESNYLKPSMGLFFCVPFNE